MAYLGFRDLVILDDDHVETTNLNRLVTADQADLQSRRRSPHVAACGRSTRAINVRTLPGLTTRCAHPELRDVDLIIGCVDHDGPAPPPEPVVHRHPYAATRHRHGSGRARRYRYARRPRRARSARRSLPDLPGRTRFSEISRWPNRARASSRPGSRYGTGTANPSVVYLNALAVNAALAELGAWISGARIPARWLDIDLVGTTKSPGTPNRSTPSSHPGPRMRRLLAYEMRRGCPPGFRPPVARRELLARQ